MKSQTSGKANSALILNKIWFVWLRTLLRW